MTSTVLDRPTTHANLEALLRARDDDPAYASAPVLDVYGRISKDPETGETEKVDRQLVDCLREVERRGARLGKVLRDDGKSAWKVGAKRTGWDELVARLTDRRAAGVVAWHTDRLMRQMDDLSTLIKMADAGLTVATCFGEYDLSDSDARFTLRVLTAAAAKESDNTSRRQLRKAAARREAGLMTGGPRAFGEYGSTGGATAPVELVDRERDAIRWACKAHRDGVSLSAVAREWNARGLRTVNGGEWSVVAARRVLLSPRIAGLLVHEGEVVNRRTDSEPIVSEELWRAGLALFASRATGRPVTRDYLLSGGHLLCKTCGQAMSGKAMRGKRRYSCRTRSGCGSVSIGAETVEVAVRALVITELSRPEHAAQIARQSERLAEVTAKRDKAQRTKVELARRFTEGRLDLDEWDEVRPSAVAAVERLDAEIAELQRLGADVTARRVSAEQIATEWDTATVDRRRAMVRETAPLGVWVLPATTEQHSRTADVAARLRVQDEK